MVTQLFHRLTHQQLHTRAKASLEYGMLVMLVVVSALGALSSSVHTPAPMRVASANIQLASLK